MFRRKTRGAGSWRPKTDPEYRIEKGDFLLFRQVVAGEVSGRGGPLPPLEDRYTALAILLELAVQKVSLLCQFLS